MIQSELVMAVRLEVIFRSQTPNITSRWWEYQNGTADHRELLMSCFLVPAANNLPERNVIVCHWGEVQVLLSALDKMVLAAHVVG